MVVQEEVLEENDQGACAIAPEDETNEVEVEERCVVKNSRRGRPSKNTLQKRKQATPSKKPKQKTSTSTPEKENSSEQVHSRKRKKDSNDDNSDPATKRSKLSSPPRVTRQSSKIISSNSSRSLFHQFKGIVSQAKKIND